MANFKAIFNSEKCLLYQMLYGQNCLASFQIGSLCLPCIFQLIDIMLFIYIYIALNLALTFILTLYFILYFLRSSQYGAYTSSCQ